MRIGLIDVDGHNFPNLALMRISAYHKAMGDRVEWWWSDFVHYDIVYMSKVFFRRIQPGHSRAAQRRPRYQRRDRVLYSLGGRQGSIRQEQKPRSTAGNRADVS